MADQATSTDAGKPAGDDAVEAFASKDAPSFVPDAPEGAEAEAWMRQARGDAGEAAYQAERRRAISAATDANAAIHARLMEARASFRDDPDYATLAQRWDDASRRIVDNGLAGIDNAGLRAHVRAMAGAALAREAASIEDQAFRGAADAHATYREDYLQDLLRHTGAAADNPLLAGATEAYHATIDDAVARGYLAPQAALAEKRRAALALCSAHYAALARTDPARAVGELNSRDCPHPVVQYLPAEARDGLIAQAKANEEAQHLDAARAPLLHAQQAQRASDDAESAILTDLLSLDPKVTATAIVNDARLTPEAQARLIGAAARTTKPDPPAEVSQANAVGLLDRIRRPDSDPQRIGDIRPIIEAYNAGDLSKRDLVLVGKELGQAQDGDDGAGSTNDSAASVHSAQWFAPLITTLGARGPLIVGPRPSIIPAEAARPGATTPPPTPPARPIPPTLPDPLLPPSKEFDQPSATPPAPGERAEPKDESLSPLETGSNSVATFGKAVRKDYVKTFIEAHPELEGRVWVHHAVPRLVLTKYPDVITEDEFNSIENLRGIPNTLNKTLHLSALARAWNIFYKDHPTVASKQQLLDFATQIDHRYGHLFLPKR